MRYDLLTAREYTTKNGEIKKSWTKVGSAWDRDGGGFSMTFDALPLPDKDGQVRVLAAVPKERGERKPTQELNDEIPF